LTAAIRHSSGAWNPEGRTTKLDTGLRRYDIKIFPEIEPLILGYKHLNRDAEPKPPSNKDLVFLPSLRRRTMGVKLSFFTMVSVFGSKPLHVILRERLAEIDGSKENISQHVD
jgi:hypothetical protein